MSEDNKNEIEAAVEAATKELQEKLDAEFKVKETAMVSELQEERNAKRTAQEELKKKGEQNESPGEEDPKKVFESLLAKQKEEERSQSEAAAIEEFKNKHPEFSEEKDPAGLAFKKFESELSKFRLDNVNSKGQFDSKFKEVYDYMNRGQRQEENASNYHAGSNENGGSAPGEDDTVGLSEKEAKLIKEIGWTKERFLAQKASKPQVIDSLLRLRT